MATEPLTEPSAWAMERARRALGITGHDAGCGCTACELDQKDIAIALDAARAEGPLGEINPVAKLVVRREDGTVYIGGIGMTPHEVEGLGRLLITEASNARGWIARKNQASKLEAEVARGETMIKIPRRKSANYHVFTLGSSHCSICGWDRYSIAQK